MHIEVQRIEYWESEIAQLEYELRIAEEQDDNEAIVKYMAAIDSAKRQLINAKESAGIED